MNREYDNLVELLKRRRSVYDSLAAEITAGQEACVALDLQRVECHDRQKAKLCAEVRRLDGAIANLRADRNLAWLAVQSEEQGKREMARTLRELLRSSEDARSEAGRRNKVYEAFLKRARATVSILSNVISHCTGVYPAAVQSAGSRAGRG